MQLFILEVCYRTQLDGIAGGMGADVHAALVMALACRRASVLQQCWRGEVGGWEGVICHITY